MPPDYPDGWFTLTESKLVPSGSFACIGSSASDKELVEHQKGTPIDFVNIRKKSVEKLIQHYSNAN